MQKNLNFEEIKENVFYYAKVKELAKSAFCKEEYISAEELLQMAQNENFKFLGILENENFIGFVVIYLYKDLAYLFFLAIEENYRNKGYGSAVLKQIEEMYPMYIHVVDFEKVDRSSSNYIQRSKRREFYKRNHYQKTNLFLSYRGIDFEVLSKKELDIEKFKEMMETLTVANFHPIYK